MNAPRLKLLGVLCAGIALSAAPVLAATQGTIGATSTGSLTIDAFIANLAQISSLDDIDLGNYDGTSAMSGNDQVCVFSNTGGYEVTATGDGAGNAFELSNGTDALDYGVEWADSAGAGSGTAMTSGAALQFAAPSGPITTPDCNGGTSLNARVFVDVLATDLAVAPAGTYTGVLTLTVAPL